METVGKRSTLKFWHTPIAMDSAVIPSVPRMYSNSYLANPKDGELLFNKAVEATIMDLIEFLKL